MEIHTFTVNFWASLSKARKTVLMPIYVTIRMNGERATFTTGKYIHPNDWDEVKQMARGTSDSAQAINNHLLQLRNMVYKKELELIDRGYIINATILRDACIEKVERRHSVRSLPFNLMGSTISRVFEYSFN